MLLPSLAMNRPQGKFQGHKYTIRPTIIKKQNKTKTHIIEGGLIEEIKMHRSAEQIILYIVL